MFFIFNGCILLCDGFDIITETITLSTFRKTLKTSLQKIADNHEPMVVKRQRGGGTAVLFWGDFNAMQTTLYLLSSAPHTAPTCFEVSNSSNKVAPNKFPSQH